MADEPPSIAPEGSGSLAEDRPLDHHRHPRYTARPARGNPLAGGPWDRVGFAIAWAAVGYPLAVWAAAVLIGLVVVAVQSVWYGTAVGLITGAFSAAIALIGALMASAAVVLYVGFVALMVVPALACSLPLWPSRPGWPTLGTLAAALVVLTAVAPLTLLGDGGFSNTGEWIALPVVLLTATAWTMFFGAYAGLINERRCQRTRGRWRQFSIRQIMLLMLLVSVGLACIRLGLRGNLPLVLTVGLSLTCWTLVRWPTVWLASRLYLYRAQRYRRQLAEYRALVRAAGRPLRSPPKPGEG